MEAEHLESCSPMSDGHECVHITLDMLPDGTMAQEVRVRVVFKYISIFAGCIPRL